MPVRRAITLSFLIASLLTTTATAQTDIYDSGGPLSPEHAAYDVRYYELTLDVNPADSSIEGHLLVRADIVHPTIVFVLDLDTLLTVRRVEESSGRTPTPLPFRHHDGRIEITFAASKQPGDQVALTVHYGGRPRIARRPPWDGGFTWAKTAGGAPWIATTCQTEGADIWWPNKDHPSDEPDSMALNITVPKPLVVAANGRLRRVQERGDKTTYHWFISTPINNYNVALNIAPYRTISERYTSVTGEAFPVTFWVLPESYEQGRQFFPEIIAHLRFFEETLGPYPFRADKYGVVETPHLGMEHQTIIAYGAGFDNRAMTRRDWGFDALHHHELAHEWWGNLVTNADWKDMWLHEGFGTYMQALYMEKLQGETGYHAYMAGMRHGIGNRCAVAPRESRTSNQIYRCDIYNKGAWVLHTLRHLIGDDAMRTALRRMVYPDPAMEKITDGSHCRFATTDDFLHLVEGISGQKLAWLFEVYLRQPVLPQLLLRRDGRTVELCWRVPGEVPFPLPVEVQIGDKRQRVTFESGNCATVRVPRDAEVTVDPERWLLMELVTETKTGGGN